MSKKNEFAKQLQAHIPFVRAYAMKFYRDWDKAKDLAQDVLAIAWEKRHQFEAGTNIKGWLGRITYNTFVNQYRRGDNNEYHDLSDNLYSNGVLQNADYNIGPDYFDFDLANKIILSLPPYMREPMQLRAYGYTYEEISATLDVEIGTIRSRLHRGRDEFMLRYKQAHKLPEHD